VTALRSISLLDRKRGLSRQAGRSFVALVLFLGAAFCAICPAGGLAAAEISLPAGTKIYLRLQTPVSTASSHLRSPVAARVVREVPVAAGAAIPLGAEVQGEIALLFPSSSPSQRARLVLKFTRLAIPGEPPVAISAHVSNVENARETVLPDGTIQGVLASELPISMIEQAAEKIGSKTGVNVQKDSRKYLGKTDTAIDYPAGTDLDLTLDQPLQLGRVFAPAISAQLSPGLLATIQGLLAGAPQRVEGKDGKPGDPLNLVIVGSRQEIQRAFTEAGWLEPARASGQSVWQSTRAIIAEVGYGKAPVSDLYLYGRKEDLAFAKMLNTVAKRHHLRLWRTDVHTADGREIWLGASTHDFGYDVRPGVVSHAIDPDLDDERAKVGADLAAAKLVRAEQLVTRANPLSTGLTATGATWKTDGRLLAIELVPSAAPAASTH
jgi:LssY C-terminus